MITSPQRTISNISYTLNGRPILEGITGSVRPAQVLAIIGASGAGKPTFLDSNTSTPRHRSNNFTQLVSPPEDRHTVRLGSD